MRTAILGAGNRGTIYASYATANPDEMSISAVIEPRANWCRRLAEVHSVPASNCFADWNSFAASEAIAATDAVVNATPDRAHSETANAVLDAGLAMLLEKPIAATIADIEQLAKRGAAPGTPPVVVGHVLRFTNFYRTLRRLIRDGAVGRVLSVTHRENLWFNHFAHSYVRGNWARAAESAPFILAKCCHDVDLFGWLFDDEILAVTSAGRLDHFRAENRPAQAPPRCTDGCEVDCAFDARALYLHGDDHWPANTITEVATLEARAEALATGPYGRCVYACDNDVADHQAALFEMASGATFNLTISGHHHEEVRTTTIDGTLGTIEANFCAIDPSIEVFAHLSGRSTASREPTLRVGPDQLRAASGHGGGDFGVMADFVRTVTDPSYESECSLSSSIISHRAALAAEESRLSARRVELADWIEKRG